MSDFADALFEDRDGTRISIEVTAGARTEAFPAGYNEWRKMIGCRVSAPALEGRANKAVIALVSSALDVPASSVSINSGATSSQKKVLVSGMSKNDVLELLLHKM
jgi:uncharacterized protein (TIGR00251 family)